MKIVTEIVIDRPVAAVWDIVGARFGDAHLWASSLKSSEGYGPKISGQVCESRVCDIQGMGRIREKLLEFEPSSFALTYQVIEGFPFFVRRGVNRWTLSAEGNRTRVRSNAEITTKGLIGTLMLPMMKMQMRGLMRKTFDDLKFYVENGVPHPRKQGALTPGKLARA